MSESTVEYGLPPEKEADRQKVQELFEGTWAELSRLSNNLPKDGQKIEREIQSLMDELAYLHVELPCQGVEYQGVIVDRDIEIPPDEPPAPFTDWAKALGVSPNLFENRKDK